MSTELHKHVDGIPYIYMPSDAEHCTTCWLCRIRRSDRGSHDTRQNTTLVGQVLFLDWRFNYHQSKTEGRYRKLSGPNNETAYLIIVDHLSDILWGVTSDSKRPPPHQVA
jgi:hypothetical protein